jgi:hypothetical protein
MSIQTSMDEAFNEASNGYGDAIDRFYSKLEEPGYDFGQPTFQEFVNIMDTFADWVKNETKADKTEATSRAYRAKVIRHIKEYLTQKSATVAFLHIDPAVFGIQLAMRVRRPRSIDQGNTSLCGAVSVLYSLAKREPMQFAQFALDLYVKGHALFGQLEIEPSLKTRQYYPLRRTKIPWAVDYVTLVSLRHCTFVTDKFHVGFLRGADETTLPGQIGSWLKQAGYSDVEDHTFFTKSQAKAVKTFSAKIGQPMHMGGSDGDALAKADRKNYALLNLGLAQQALHDGKIVIMFSDGELGRMARGDDFKTRTAPTKLGDHHWMAVRKIDLGADVTFKVITWGTSYTATLSLDHLVPRYNGFICAKP